MEKNIYYNTAVFLLGIRKKSPKISEKLKDNLKLKARHFRAPNPNPHFKTIFLLYLFDSPNKFYKV